MTRHRITVLLGALVLAAGSLAAAAGPAGAASGRPPVLAAAAAGQPAPPQDPPAEFGTDWHDPVTAAPPVSRPATASCELTLAEARFRDFTPYLGSYVPPTGCAGAAGGSGSRWAKVVLRLDGKVQGRQYDRLGHLSLGGVEILRTSTPEPSPDGITWSVEKDVTRYRDTLSRPQPVEMLIGNVVDDIYTGVIEVKVTLTFYAADGRTPAPGTPDRVLPLTAPTVTTPRNTERLLAEVYATGSGGGCEEYWYMTTPETVPYSCKAAGGPYREVRITVDGRLAGIAAPFPTVWTGGWSNPFLWYVTPAPRAFDVQPVVCDLTPYAALLNDGRPHRIEVSVAGVPAGQTGWSTPANLLLWQDEQRAVVTGALTRHEEGEPADSGQWTPGSPTTPHRLDTEGGHRLTVAGRLDTSHGRVTTTVTRAVHTTSVHRWNQDESRDALTGSWTDEESVTRGPATVRTARTYTVDGETTVDAASRLRTVITLGDRAETVTLRGGHRVDRSWLDDRYTGDASYTANVPRDRRHAVGTSEERYRLYGAETGGGCYDRTLATAQGALTVDRRRC